MNTLTHKSSVQTHQTTLSINWLHALKDALTAGVLTLLVLGPITIRVLKQYDFVFLPWRQPLAVNGIAIALLVCLGRFAVAVLAQTASGVRFLNYFKRSDAHNVQVESRTAPPLSKTLSLFAL